MKRSMMQVYVKGSVEAAELYMKAFNAIMGNEYRNEDNTFLHVELNVYGHIIAISETNDDKITGNTMQFCFHYGQGYEKSIENAYNVLKEGSQILHALGPCPFSPSMTDLIDKFGVRWCLFI